MSTSEEKPNGNSMPSLPELTFGRRTTAAPSISLPERWTSPADDDWDNIVACCQLKAEACRWAARRRRLLAERADFQREIAPRDRAIVAKAKELGDCFLWMCSTDSPAPSDASLYDDISNGFEAVAAGVLLLHDNQTHRRTTDLKQTLMLLAESQLVLREAIQRIGGPVDSDQVRVFNLVKQTAAAGHVHLVHHMRVQDSADPKSGAELLSRIRSFRRQRQESVEKEQQLQPLFEQLRNKLSTLGNNSSASGQLWREVISLIEQLVNSGVPPSQRLLREMILPLIDQLPETIDIPPGVELVLREMDRHLAEVPSPVIEESTESTAEVEAVAQLLKGRTIVLIGGDRRAHAEVALKRAFRLRDLVWISTRSHESTAGFEPPINQPDVAMVLLAIRWASHSFGDIKAFCHRAGKPLVRLPGGYNPQQVAVQILKQASGMLAATDRSLE